MTGRSILVAAAVLLGAPVADAAPKAKRADLVPRAASARLSGEKVAGTVTIANRGAVAAKATSVVVAWRQGRGSWTRRGSYATKALRPGKSVTVVFAFKPPADAQGRYDIRACADERGRVKERSEKNNCRSVGQVALPAGPTPAPSPLPSSPAATPAPAATPEPTATATPAASPTATATPAPTAASSSLTWAGTAGGASWSLPGNWEEGAAPSAATPIDLLDFPELACALCRQSHNDIEGLSVDTLSIEGLGYSITGRALDLGAGLAITSPVPAAQGFNSLSVPLTLTADQTWDIAGPGGLPPNQSFLDVSGSLTGPGRELTINLSGGAAIGLSGAPNELGPVRVQGIDPAVFPDFNGSLVIPGSLNAASGAPITVDHASLQPNGTLGPVTIQSGRLRVGENGGAHTLRPASLTLTAGSSTAFFLYSAGGTAGTDYSQLQSDGAVALAGSLQVVNFDQTCAPLPLGQVYTLISTTGSLSGTFTGPAQLSITPSGVCPAPTRRLQIDYHAGGETKTVTATVVA
jgi:hypothetical protein